jgi:hypothetical protein
MKKVNNANWLYGAYLFGGLLQWFFMVMVILVTATLTVLIGS